MNSLERKKEAFGRLLTIMDELREQCPWDKKQTIQSLRHLTIEEVYELADAILDDDRVEIRKELGDILLHIVFYARIASETNDFDIADVIDSLCEKVIHRHPHIYSDTVVKDEEEVSRNWEKLKLQEGKKSVLEGVPGSLPALVKAMRVQEKARAAGFDWEQKEQVWEKVSEEMNELREAIDSGLSSKVEEEFGDVLFAMVNYGRFVGVNPEDALERTNKKFIRRFKYMEERIAEAGLKFSDLNLQEMDVFWDEAKSKGL
ncbi:MAG: nucleoside triphosphate pyrophosphohydrolase [Sphingobacteriales bacterium]|jgi:XTP/dITP diphosphohydrolase|nr:nucleoside triphosphate pyrophosphohydrolase [Sphingobacteriales bacterium]